LTKKMNGKNRKIEKSSKKQLFFSGIHNKSQKGFVNL
jgi:hypothetical protein